MSRREPEIYEFGDFRLDVGEHRVERLSGEPCGSLQEKAFQTLLALVRNSGRLVTKDELLSVVWPETIVEENNLGKAVYAVRSFLGEPAKKYIETVPKHGYRFVAEVRRIASNGSGGDRLEGALDAGHRVFIGTSPAYDLYVRGKVKAGSENIEDTENAIKVLEAAIAIDPYFAPAYAQLARAYNTRAFKFSAGPQTKLLQENAEVAVEKALALDPNLAEAHFARGLILWTKTKGFPHEQAIRSYKRSLELDPNSDEAHHQLSMVYSHTGLLDEAQHEVGKCLEINPNNTMARFRVGVYCQYQGRFEDAQTILKSIPRDVSPLLVERTTAEVLIQSGRLAEAEAIVDAHLARYPKDEGGSFASVKALLLVKAGKPGEAESLILRAQEIGRDFGHFHHTAHNIASACAAMGRQEDAMKWLEHAADNGFPNFTYFRVDPNLEPLRGSAEFNELVGKMETLGKRLRTLQ